MRTVADLKVKIFADGADLPAITKLYANPVIKGFTTNPTLMRKSGVTDYAAFARSVLAAVPDRPVSFEGVAGGLPEMERQAHEIASGGAKVHANIPGTNTTGG